MPTQRKIYILRFYDEPMVRFTVVPESTSLGPIERIQDIQLLSADRRLFPVTLSHDLTPEIFHTWIKKRIIPPNRTHVDSILNSAGISHNLISTFLNISLALSLNDSFWITPEGFTGSFAEFNLYKNQPDKNLSSLAFTGTSSSASRDTHSFPGCPKKISLQLTTGGILAKAWRRRKDGKIHLHKAGSTGACTLPDRRSTRNAGAGLEPYSEFYVSKLAQYMGLNAVDYDLRRWKGILASVCELFTDIDTAYVPVGHIVRDGGIKACVDYYDSLGESFGQSIRNMLVFDALVC